MPQSQSPSSSRGSRSRRASGRQSQRKRQQASTTAPGVAGVIEQLVSKIFGPFDVVMISRRRIQQTLDEAAERGRMTRTDADELVGELVRRGQQQTDELLTEFERLMARERGQLDSEGPPARGSDSVDQLVRGAGRTRRHVGTPASQPISDYDELTASQVNKRLTDLSRQELRRIREYESRHANRKSVLDAIDRALR